jgi:hypothetical protein
MAKRLYATQLRPGMVLSSGYMLSLVVREAPDLSGKTVEVFSVGAEGEAVFEAMPNGEGVPGGRLPAGKVRVRFSDGVEREMDESSRFKVMEQL